MRRGAFVILKEAKLVQKIRPVILCNQCTSQFQVADKSAIHFDNNNPRQDGPATVSCPICNFSVVVNEKTVTEGELLSKM